MIKKILVTTAALIGLALLALLVETYAQKAAGEAAKRQEQAAIQTLKNFMSPQSIFRECDRDQNREFDYGNLRLLFEAGLIDQELGTGTKDGYVFKVYPGNHKSEDTEYLWYASADPVEPNPYNNRSFLINQFGEAFGRSKGPITALDDRNVATQNDVVRLHLHFH